MINVHILIRSISLIEQKMNKIAIVGSGFTGLSLALHLPKNVQITMFDKSRRAGGRVCTRTTRQNPGYSFDHGLAFVNAGPQLMNFLTEIQAIKEAKLRWCSSWNKKSEITTKSVYSGNPNVESITLNLLQRIMQEKKNTNCKYGTRISAIVTDQKSKVGELKVVSEDKQEYGPFNFVYICIPYPQCRMLHQNLIQLPAQNEGQNYFCHWVLMVADEPNSEMGEKLKGIDVCESFGENIGKMISQNWKKMKTQDSLWVFHMDEKWSEENKNLSKEEVEKEFCQQLQQQLKLEKKPCYVKAHRWLYARPRNTPQQVLVGRNIAMGADWVGGGTDIEHCWKVGKQLSKIFKEGKGNL